jgi:excisionase family DNA binding protein
MSFERLQNAENAAFDIPRTANRLNCSEPHVRFLIRSGQLRAKKLGRRVLILKHEIDRYLEDLPDWTPGDTPEPAVEARRKSGLSRQP